MYSIDLFTGVGGITLALHNIAHPIAYCDNSSNAEKVLTKLMADGKLPKAPLCDDVKLMNKAWIKKNCKHKPQMIIAGFPCTSLSKMGLQKGFKDKDKSGLFYEILRLTDEMDIPFLFLENVPPILKLEMNNVVKELTKRGFAMRWCVNSAENMGAPHQRKRWFCLAYKQLLTIKQHGTLYNPFVWNKRNEPARTICTNNKVLKRNYNIRCALLGNSVVPDAVRCAFLYLVNGFVHPKTMNYPSLKLQNLPDHKNEFLISSKQDNWPRFGAIEKNTCYVFKPSIQKLKIYHKERLVFDPKHYKSKSPPDNRLKKEDLLKKPQSKKQWSTPRFGNTRPSNYLTKRCILDLPSQIRFEVNTKNPHCPINPVFIEFLMGYPPNWTNF